MITKKHTRTYRNCDTSTITKLLMQGIEEIQNYTQTMDYRQVGEMPGMQVIQAGLQAATQTLKKRLLKQAERLHRKVQLRAANQFLHLLCMRLLRYGPDMQVAQVVVSEKEAKIMAARKAWVKARTEAEALRLAYLAEKGDFYTRSV